MIKGKLIDSKSQLLATIDVEPMGGVYEGRIRDLVCAPGTLELFNAYESAVLGQLFRNLDDIEQQIDAMGAVFVADSGERTPLADLQVYPSTMSVSFRVVR